MPVVETGEADVYDWQHLRRFGRPRLRLRPKKQDIFKFLSESEFVLHLGQQLLNINGRISGDYFESTSSLKMKFRDWLSFKFPINEIIVGGSSTDHNDAPVIHPIGVAPQFWRTFDLNLLESWETLNENPCYHNVNKKCAYGTDRRKALLKKMEGCDFMTYEGITYGRGQRITFNDFFTSLLNHKFSVSPEGNGIDCHRHYETILAKGIPIVQVPDEEYVNGRWGTNSYMEKYDDLPVLWTKDYTELSTEYLEEKYEEFLETEFDFSRMTITYWAENSEYLLQCMEYWKQKFFRNDPREDK
jgi:hypothetical protein